MEKNNKRLAAIVAVLALVVAIVGGIFLWKTLHPGPPPLTSTTLTLGQFVLSEPFMKLPYDKQKEYLGALETRNSDDELEKLWKAQKLTDPQMGTLREGAWMGKYIGRMDKFFSAPPGLQRAEYIGKVVDKIKNDPIEPDPQPGDKLPKRDKKWGKKVVETWPADVQQQWKEFHKAITAEEDRRKKEAKKAKEAGGGAATKPAGAATKASKG